MILKTFGHSNCVCAFSLLLFHALLIAHQLEPINCYFHRLYMHAYGIPRAGDMNATRSEKENDWELKWEKFNTMKMKLWLWRQYDGDDKRVEYSIFQRLVTNFTHSTLKFIQIYQSKWSCHNSLFIYIYIYICVFGCCCWCSFRLFSFRVTYFSNLLAIHLHFHAFNPE